MAQYLSMDGVDDVLQLPTMTASKVVIDCYIDSTQNNTRDTLFDARSGSTYFIDIGFTNLRFKINGGAEKTSHLDIPKDSRNVLDIRSSFSSVTTWTDNTTVFAKNDGTNPLAGKIYNVKLYNDTTLVAHYDMTTGTVQDQSGNGNHATLTGGTWLDDGASSVIDAGTITISADGSLTTNGSLLLNGTSIFDAVSSLTIEAESITPDSPINLSADGSLSVEASIVYNGVVTLSADTSLDAVANLIINGISSLSASGSLTVEGISYDPSKQIITKIQLNGVRELTVKSEGQRELTYQVTTTRNLITRLEGES